MNSTRRKFTREFKLAAVRRLEMGSSAAEVARASEGDPNALHRWRREFRDGVGTAFPGLGQDIKTAGRLVRAKARGVKVRVINENREPARCGYSGKAGPEYRRVADYA